MYQLGEVDRLKSEFNKKQMLRRKILKKAWGILLIIVIVLCVAFLFIFPEQFRNEETAWILPTYGGIALFVTLVGFLVSINYNSEKPFFMFLYKELYSKINLDEGLYLEYEAYTKMEKTFNKEGGLFPRYATNNVKRHIKGTTNDDNQFNIYDCTITTSSGKSQTTHFNGVYFSIDKPLRTTIQIRSKGTARVKGLKFDRVVEFQEFRVYKKESEQMTSLDHVLIQFMRSLKQTLQYKGLYLSVMNNRINVALWYKKHPARKLAVINMNEINLAYRYFLSEIELINKLDTVGEY